jgi:hypothetical protein
MKGLGIFMRKLRRRPYGYRPARHRLFSPFALVGVLVPVVLALVAAGFIFGLPHLSSHAAANVNGDCALIVPPNPLSAQGLATPYQLVATDPANGPCHEVIPAQSAFIQGAVINPATGHISIYNPLVIDQGTKPAAAPVVPTLPNGAVVGLWFGSNGNTLTLKGSGGSLQQGHCVNGLSGSIFGQVSYCNAPAFFQAANQAIQAGKLVPPALGKAKDGLPCPTSRDFSIVDQDQSDNVTTFYLITPSGKVAQDTKANVAALGGQVQKNGSDERLITVVDSALGCIPWTAPDLADPGQNVPALPLNELQAAALQQAPIGLVPSRDPMVLVNNKSNLDKINAYRAGVDQPIAPNLQAASTLLYCTNLLAVAPQRLLLDARFTKVQPPVDPAVANNLFTFLAQRFVFTYEKNGLNCMKLLGQPDPVTLKKDANGVAIDATINDIKVYTPFNCSVNGTLLVGCSGTTTINGQMCSFTMDKNARQVNITCHATGQ